MNKNNRIFIFLLTAPSLQTLIVKKNSLSFFSFTDIGWFSQNLNEQEEQAPSP